MGVRPVELSSGEDRQSGLPCKQLFLEPAERELARAAHETRPLALLCLDVDGLAQINESHGQATGDAVLRLVGLAIGLSCRRADLATRTHDDEFLVMAPFATGAAGVIVARRIQETLARLVSERRCPVRSLSVSVGIADLERVEEPDLAALEVAARGALIHAKAGARNGGGVALAPRKSLVAPRLVASRTVALVEDQDLAPLAAQER